MITFDGAFSFADLRATLDALGNDVFFVQIGAMDGVSFDPIFPLIKKNGWKGLLVEPIPDMFEKLKANYGDSPGLSFVNAAVADYDGTIDMTRIDPEACDKGLIVKEVLGISTLMPDRGIIGGAAQITPEAQKVIDAYKRTIEVPCLMLQSLLTRENVSKIDLFVVDTEGADWMVARQLPLATYRPRIVYIEFDHLSIYEKTACCHHFRNNGYRIYLEKEASANFLAIRNQ